MLPPGAAPLSDRQITAQPSPTKYARLRARVESPILYSYEDSPWKSVDGKVVLYGVTLEERTSVTVLARDNEGAFTLTPEEEAEQLLAIAEADRGETVSAEEVLSKLAPRQPS